MQRYRFVNGGYVKIIEDDKSKDDKSKKAKPQYPLKVRIDETR